MDAPVFDPYVVLEDPETYHMQLKDDSGLERNVASEEEVNVIFQVGEWQHFREQQKKDFTLEHLESAV